MRLDIRLPIGFMFTLLGLLLTGYGLFTRGALYQRSLGINVNLNWGLVLLAFGLLMLVLGWRKSAAHGPKTDEKDAASGTGKFKGMPH